MGENTLELRWAVSGSYTRMAGKKSDDSDTDATVTAIRSRVPSDSDNALEVAGVFLGAELPALEDGVKREGSPLCAAEARSRTRGDHDCQKRAL